MGEGQAYCTVKALRNSSLAFIRAFFWARNVVLGVGDFLVRLFQSLYYRALIVTAALFLAALAAFICVFFGASKTVGAVVFFVVLLYFFFDFFRSSRPPGDRFEAGRRVTNKDESDDYV